jgi:hypothetical protein
VKTRLVLGFLLSVCAVACNKDDAKSTTTASVAAPLAAATATPPSAADTKTGIPECDALLARMLACIASNNVSEPMKASYRRNFDKARDGYRRAGAGTAEEKLHGGQACQTGLEAGKAFFDTCT